MVFLTSARRLLREEQFGAVAMDQQLRALADFTEVWAEFPTPTW